MKIDFKKEVLKRKDDLIKDLQALIRINSELTTFDPNRKGAPFGEGNREALDLMLNIGKNDGFETVNLDGYAGHIEYGNQKDYVAMIGHLDVVPAGNNWDYPPYGAEIHNNKMYGRGTEDDKGPTIAAYYALKILKELNVPLSKRIKLILGSDEETAWRCVRHYFSVYPEVPVSGFIPDADFPLIYAEKGITRLYIDGKATKNDILAIEGGFRDNMVPDFARAKLTRNEEYAKAFTKFIKANEYEGKCVLENDHLLVEVSGISAHGSTPEFGKNAIDRLFEFFNYLKIQNELTDFVNQLLIHDARGEKLGVSFHDEEMGPLTNNFGVINYEDGNYRIVLNLRYPNGITLDEIKTKIETAIKPFNATVTVDKHQLLLYKDPNSELVKTLMSVYQKHTNDYASKPITIGGGTFARAIPNVLAFGPHFLGKPTFIHQKNEFIDLDDLILATIIYTEALYELAK